MGQNNSKDTMEYKCLELDFEFKADEEKRIVEGYASIFGNVDSHRDIIQQGAFRETIKDGMEKKFIKCMRDHYRLIGHPIDMFEDSKGLYVKNKISKTSEGNDTLQLIKDGSLNQMSIGYIAKKFHYEKDEVNGYNNRIITEVKLFETSYVTWGSNSETGILSVKNLQGIDLDGIYKELKEIKEFMEEIKSGKNLKSNIEEFETINKGKLGETEFKELSDLLSNLKNTVTK